MHAEHYVIIGIMLIAGLGGGATNLLRQAPEDSQGLVKKLAPFALGVAAAFATPLFLSLAKSQIIENLLENHEKTKSFSADIFIFFGFCLVASLSSKVFLERLTDQVLSLKSQVSALHVKTGEIKEDQEAIEATLESPPDEAVKFKNEVARRKSTPEESVSLKVSPMAKMCLKALANGAFVWRSVSKMAKELGLSRETMEKVLNELVASELVDSKTVESGHRLYRITALGKLRLG